MVSSIPTTAIVPGNENTAQYVLENPDSERYRASRRLCAPPDPSGGFFQKLAESFSRTRIYAVDPLRDRAGILRKALVADFTCNALQLADFEGMCLGPALPDGRYPLLLLADSQSGMNGLVQEYVKVLLLKGL